MHLLNCKSHKMITLLSVIVALNQNNCYIGKNNWMSNVSDITCLIMQPNVQKYLTWYSLTHMESQEVWGQFYKIEFIHYYTDHIRPSSSYTILSQTNPLVCCWWTVLHLSLAISLLYYFVVTLSCFKIMSCWTCSLGALLNHALNWSGLKPFTKL